MGEDLTSATFIVNDEEVACVFPTHHTLLEVLREQLNLAGTKHGCELGECGACTVLMDGQPTLSCLQLAAEAVDSKIETVEGLQDGNDLHPLQVCFADLGASQCGYCTSGILLTAKAYLKQNPSPSEAQIRAALGGNLCRCTGYQKIIEAVSLAAEILAGNKDAQPAREILYGSPLPAQPAKDSK